MKIEKGGLYLCIKEWKKLGTSFTENKLYECEKDNCLADDFGNLKSSLNGFFREINDKEHFWAYHYRKFKNGDLVRLYLKDGTEKIRIKYCRINPFNNVTEYAFECFHNGMHICYLPIKTVDKYGTKKFI